MIWCWTNMIYRKENTLRILKNYVILKNLIDYEPAGLITVHGAPPPKKKTIKGGGGYFFLIGVYCHQHFSSKWNLWRYSHWNAQKRGFTS